MSRHASPSPADLDSRQNVRHSFASRALARGKPSLEPVIRCSSTLAPDVVKPQKPPASARASDRSGCARQCRPRTGNRCRIRSGPWLRPLDSPPHRRSPTPPPALVAKRVLDVAHREAPPQKLHHQVFERPGAALQALPDRGRFPPSALPRVANHTQPLPPAAATRPDRCRWLLRCFPFRGYIQLYVQTTSTGEGLGRSNSYS